MGVVYLAHDEQLRRPVAVKFLPPVRAASFERLIRFRDEARALSALNHPNIVTVYETGEADTVPFLAMELVDGETLRDKLARGSLPLREALEIARQVAAGVAAAHESGIVHRDLKPENAMVRGDGYVKVLDFGVAGLCEPIQQAAVGHAWRGAALRGLVTGTPPYMAPEQIEGAPADPSNDVFTLGVLLCEMTTGANPFRRATIVDTLRAIDDAPVSAEAAIRSLPPAVAALIGSALQRDPARRCASAAVFGDEARRLAADLDSAAARRVRTRQLRRYAAAAIAVVALTAAAATPSIVRARRVGWVGAIAIPEIRKLTAGDRTVAAFRLLQQAEAILPGDPALLALAQETTRTVTVRTRPGTVVDVRDYLDRSDDWLRLGTAPLDKIRVPAGYLAWRASSGGQSYTIAPPTARHDDDRRRRAGGRPTGDGAGPGAAVLRLPGVFWLARTIRSAALLHRPGRGHEPRLPEVRRCGRVSPCRVLDASVHDRRPHAVLGPGDRSVPRPIREQRPIYLGRRTLSRGARRLSGFGRQLVRSRGLRAIRGEDATGAGAVVRHHPAVARPLSVEGQRRVGDAAAGGAVAHSRSVRHL